MRNYDVVPLDRLIQNYDEYELTTFLKDFNGPNRDVNRFLEHKAIDFEKADLAKTNLVVTNYQGSLKIAGYFSLSAKSLIFEKKEWKKLSNNQKRKLRPMGAKLKRNESYYDIPAILLGQLGKNYKYCNGKLISGELLLKFVYESIAKATNVVAARVLYLEAEDINQLTEFYTKNGFAMLKTFNDKKETKPFIREKSQLHLFIKKISDII